MLCGLLASLALVATCQTYQEGPPPPDGYNKALIGCLKPAEPGDSPGKPPSPTIDDVIVKLEAIQAKKKALEQEEKEAISLLNELRKAQQKRLEKLGLADTPQATPLPVTQPLPGAAYGNPPPLDSTSGQPSTNPPSRFLRQ
jgi:hypothetical protein